jgi:hypothetical protein
VELSRAPRTAGSAGVHPSSSRSSAIRRPTRAFGGDASRKRTDWTNPIRFDSRETSNTQSQQVVVLAGSVTGERGDLVSMDGVARVIGARSRSVAGAVDSRVRTGSNEIAGVGCPETRLGRTRIPTRKSPRLENDLDPREWVTRSRSLSPNFAP